MLQCKGCDPDIGEVVQWQLTSPEIVRFYRFLLLLDSSQVNQGTWSRLNPSRTCGCRPLKSKLLYTAFQAINRSHTPSICDSASRWVGKTIVDWGWVGDRRHCTSGRVCPSKSSQSPLQTMGKSHAQSLSQPSVRMCQKSEDPARNEWFNLFIT